MSFTKSATLHILVTFWFCVKVCPGLALNVTVPEGGNALLPCDFTQSELLYKRNVIWSDPKDNTLVVIVNQTTEQAKADHVKTFPDQYSSGNFSMLIMKVEKKHKGTYECFMASVKPKFLHLSVTDAPKIEVSPKGGAAVHHISWVAFVILSVEALFL